MRQRRPLSYRRSVLFCTGPSHYEIQRTIHDAKFGRIPYSRIPTGCRRQGTATEPFVVADSGSGFSAVCVGICAEESLLYLPHLSIFVSHNPNTSWPLATYSCRPYHSFLFNMVLGISLRRRKNKEAPVIRPSPSLPNIAATGLSTQDWPQDWVDIASIKQDVVASSEQGQPEIGRQSIAIQSLAGRAVPSFHRPFRPADLQTSTSADPNHGRKSIAWVLFLSRL